MLEFLLNILSKYDLEDDQSFCLYTLRNDDKWPWGLVCMYRNPAKIVNECMKLMDKPYTAGMWLSIESDDGTFDHLVFKWQTPKNGEPVEVDHRKGE